MTSRGEVSQQEVQNAVDETESALSNRLIQKGYGSFASRHEILGILEEELYEFKCEVHDGTDDSRIRELEDIAVGAIFGIACIRARKVDW